MYVYMLCIFSYNFLKNDHFWERRRWSGMVHILQIDGDLFPKFMRKSRQIYGDLFPRFMRKLRYFSIIRI